jgi:hypothetical protein
VLGSAQNFGHQKGNGISGPMVSAVVTCYGLDMTGLQSDFRGN